MRKRKLFTACQMFICDNKSSKREGKSSIKKKNKAKRWYNIQTFLHSWYLWTDVTLSLFWGSFIDLQKRKDTCFVSYSMHLNPQCVFTGSGNHFTCVFLSSQEQESALTKAQLFPQLTGYVFGFNWAPFSSAQMESTWKKPCTWFWSATELLSYNYTLKCPEPEDRKQRFLILFWKGPIECFYYSLFSHSAQMCCVGINLHYL